MISEPILTFGQSGVANLLHYGEHHQDIDVPISLLQRTVEIAPAGIGGKSVFHRLFMAVTFTLPFHLRLTPIVDGKVPAGEYADIEITQADYDDVNNDLVIGERRTHLFEIALSLPYIRGGVERFRRALKGSYFQVEITQPTPLIDVGDLILENLELEYEVITKGSVQ